MRSNLGGRARYRALLALTVVACGDARSNSAKRDPAQLARDIRLVTLSGTRDLRESSAATASHRQSAVVFTVDDSDNSPTLFALDTTGADRGTWRVSGASNTDWESLSLGPCEDAARDCLYIGDTGDNDGAHPSRSIYRFDEPDAKAKRSVVLAERLRYVYADGPHDVEAMYVARNGDMFFITKRPLLDSARLPRPALVFSLPAKAWKKETRAVAQLVDSLPPIVPGGQALMLVTDAALSPDAHHLVVRTYTQAYVFATDSVTGRVNHAIAPRICELESLGEPQGEGVTWMNNAGRMAFTSEGKAQPLRLASCGLPRAANHN
jgi:hypothetical protein